MDNVDQLTLDNLERLLRLKRYFLSSAKDSEEVRRLQREIESVETHIALRKIEEGVRTDGEEEGDGNFHSEEESEVDKEEPDSFAKTNLHLQVGISKKN
jgi:hypothetical protein